MSQSIWDTLAQSDVQATLNSAPDTFQQHLQEETLLQQKAADLAARLENKKKRLGYLQESNHNQLDNMGTGFSKIDGKYYNNANKIYNNDSAEHRQEVFGEAAANGYYWDDTTKTVRDNITKEVIHGKIGANYFTNNVNGNNNLEKYGYVTLNADSGLSPEEQLKSNYNKFAQTDQYGNKLNGGYDPTRDGVNTIIMGKVNTMKGLEAYMHGSKQDLAGREYDFMSDSKVDNHVGRSYSEIVKAGSVFGDSRAKGQDNSDGEYSLEDLNGIAGIAAIKNEAPIQAHVWGGNSAYNPLNWGKQFAVGLGRETYDMVDTVGDIGTGLYSRATDGKMRDLGGTTAEKDAWINRHGGAMSAEGQQHNRKMHQYVTEAFTGVSILHPSTWGKIKGGKLLDAIGEGVATPENAARSLGTLLPYMVGAVEKAGTKLVGAVIGDGVKASLAVEGIAKAGAEVTAGKLTAEEAAVQTAKLTAGMDADSIKIIDSVADNTQAIAAKVSSGAITKDASVKLLADEANKLKGVGQFAQYNAKVDEITAGIANKTMSHEAGKIAKKEAWNSLTGRAKIAVKSAEIFPAMTYGMTIENQSADTWYQQHGTLMDTTSLITGTMVNTVFGSFDIKVTKDILAGVKDGRTFANALIKSVKDKGKLAKISAMVAKGLITLGADAGKEVGQEFTQSWGEAFTSQLNGLDSVKEAATGRNTLVQAAEGAVAAPGVAVHMAGAGKVVRTVQKAIKGPDEETKNINDAKKDTIYYNQDTVDTKHKELDKHIEDGSLPDAVATYKDIRDNVDEKVGKSTEHTAKMEDYKSKLKEMGEKVKKEIAGRDSKDMLGSSKEDKALFDSMIATDMLTGTKPEEIVKSIHKAADKLNVQERQVDDAVTTVEKIAELKKTDKDAAEALENVVLGNGGKAKVAKAELEKKIKDTTAEIEAHNKTMDLMRDAVNTEAGRLGEGDTPVQKYNDGRNKIIEKVKNDPNYKIPVNLTENGDSIEYNAVDIVRHELMHEKPRKGSIPDKYKKALDKMDMIREVEDSNNFDLKNSDKYNDTRKSSVANAYKYTKDANKELYAKAMESIAKHSKKNTYKSANKAYKDTKKAHDDLNAQLNSTYQFDAKSKKWTVKKGKLSDAKANQVKTKVSKGKEGKQKSATPSRYNDTRVAELTKLKALLAKAKVELVKKDKTTNTEKAAKFAKSKIKEIDSKITKERKSIDEAKVKYGEDAKVEEFNKKIEKLEKKKAKLVEKSKSMISTYSKAEKISKDIKDLDIESIDKYFSEHKNDFEDIVKEAETNAKVLATQYMEEHYNKSTEEDAKASLGNDGSEEQANKDAQAHLDNQTESDAKAHLEHEATVFASLTKDMPDIEHISEEEVKADALQSLLNKSKELAKQVVDSDGKQVKLTLGQEAALEAEQVKDAFDASVIELKNKKNKLEDAQFTSYNDSSKENKDALDKAEKEYEDAKNKYSSNNRIVEMLKDSASNADKGFEFAGRNGNIALLKTFDMVKDKGKIGSILATIDMEDGNNPKLAAIADKYIELFENELTDAKFARKEGQLFINPKVNGTTKQINTNAKINDPSLFLLYNNEASTMNRNAALVMGAVLEDFMATTAGRLVHNDYDKVRALTEAATNMDNEEIGDTSHYFQDGELMKNVLEPLANNFIRAMGLSLNKTMKEVERDKVVATLGFKMIQIGIAKNYFVRINNDNKNDKGESTVLDVKNTLGWTDANDKATMMMLRIKTPNKGDMFDTVNKAKNNAVSKMLVELLEGEATESGPQFNPPINTKSNSNENNRKVSKGESNQRISDPEEKATEIFEHQEFNLNMDAMKELIDLDEDKRNIILGIVSEDFDGVVSKTQDSIRSKNAKARQEWDDALELYNKIESGEVNNAMWFKLFTSRNMRTTIRSNTINPATVKLHRFLVTPKIMDSKANSINIKAESANDSVQHADMYKAIASGFGIGIDKMNTFEAEAIGKHLYKMSDKDLNDIQKQLLDGVESIEISDIKLDAKSVDKYNKVIDKYNKEIEADKAKGEDSEFAVRDANRNIVTDEEGNNLYKFKIAEKVDATKTITAELEIEELSHLVATVAELKRKNKALANGDAKFIPNFQVEVDGTSNGVGHKSLQQIEKNAGDNLRRLGIYIGSAIPDALHGMNSIDANKLMQDLDAYENLAEKTEPSKPEWMTQEAYDVLKEYLPEFKAVEGAIDKKARTMAKPSLMQTGYGAFVSTVKRTLGYDVMYGQSNSGKISDMNMEQQLFDEAAIILADTNGLEGEAFKTKLNKLLSGKDSKPMLMKMFKGMLPNTDHEAWATMLETIKDKLTSGKTLSDLKFGDLGFDPKFNQEKSLIQLTDGQEEQRTTTMGNIAKLKYMGKWSAKATVGNYLTSAISDIYAEPLVKSLYDTYGDTFKSNRIIQNSTTAMGAIFIATAEELIKKEADRLNIAPNELSVHQLDEITKFIVNDAVKGKEATPGLGLNPGFNAAGKGSFISTIDKDKDTAKQGSNGSATTNVKLYSEFSKTVSILAKKYVTTTQSPLVLATQSSDATNMAELISSFNGELVNVFDAIVVKAARASEATEGFNEKFLQIGLNYNMPYEVYSALDRMVTNAESDTLLKAEELLSKLDDIHAAKDDIPTQEDINKNLNTETNTISSIKEIYNNMLEFVNNNNTRKKKLLLDKQVTVSQFALSDAGVYSKKITAKDLEDSHLDTIEIDNAKLNDIYNKVPSHIQKAYDTFSTRPELKDIENRIVANLESTEKAEIINKINESTGNKSAKADSIAVEIANIINEQRFKKGGDTKVKLDTIFKGESTMLNARIKSKDDFTIEQAKALRTLVEEINDRPIYWYAIDKLYNGDTHIDVDIGKGTHKIEAIPMEVFNNAVAKGRRQYDIDLNKEDEEEQETECKA